MEIITLVLATSLACKSPGNDIITGLWEAASVSRGGIGHNIEFRNDGTYTMAVTVLIELSYEIKNGKFFMSHNKGESIDYDKGAKIEITKLGFTLTNENGETEVKIKERPSKEKTIVGKYIYRHYTGAMAFEKYTNDGIVKFRLPKKSFSGCFFIDENTIKVTRPHEETVEMKYKLSNTVLYLNNSEGKNSYNFVSEGTWYESKEIDYVKPQ